MKWPLKIIILSLVSFSVFASSYLNILVFENGIPKKDFELIINGKLKAQTDKYGSVVKELKSGKHFLEFQDNEKNVKSINFITARSESTEVIINLFSNQKEIRTSKNEPKELSKKLNGKKGQFLGVLKDSNNQVIKGAKVFIQGIDEVLTTDKNGIFSSTLPTGNYTVSFTHSKYKTKTINQVLIKENEKTIQKVELVPAGLELQEFIVVAPHIEGSMSALIEVRKNSSQVAEVLGSEQISKSGDSDAASSLKRVTGLSIIDGKYVYIRGLGERYSNVLVNKSSIPSPDPTRRVVQLDLFPSGVIESLVIQKSYSPEYPGNFAGGMVNLKTKSIPSKFISKVSIGTSYSSGENNILTYKGGARDYLGMDDGTRELPQSIKNATANGKRLSEKTEVNKSGNTKDELKQFSKEINRNYSTKEEKIDLPPSLSMTIGDLYKHRGKKMGYLMSALYSDKWSHESKEKFGFQSDGTQDFSKNSSISKRTVKLSGLVNLGIDYNRFFKFSLNNMILRKTSDSVSIEEKIINSGDTNRVIELEWQERELRTHQLSGEHQLGQNKKRKLSWFSSYSRARRYRPNYSTYTQNKEGRKYITSTDGKLNEKLFNDIIDRTNDNFIKIETPLFKNQSVQFFTQLGFQQTSKKRVSDTKTFNFGDINEEIVRNTTGDENVLEKTFEDICTNEVIDKGGCILKDLTSGSDRYEANQLINAYFIDNELKLKDILKMNIGTRFEKSLQSIKTYDRVDNEPLQGSLVMEDYLPSISSTIYFQKNLQLRLAYSETISRPDLKDLNPGSYYDDEKGRAINGNINLLGTIITNKDIRLEWYFGQKENISLGYFTKDFKNPIEEVFGSFNSEGELASAEASYQLANIGNAKASGIELEARKNLGFLHPMFSHYQIGGNYSLIDSEMIIFDHLSSQVTNKNRPLQGQSAYILNLSLQYDNLNKGRQFSILYNIFGRRIDSVGIKPFKDTYEEPFKQLDMVYSQKVFEDSSIKLKVQNILDPEVNKTEDSKIIEKFRKGRELSMSYSKVF